MLVSHVGVPESPFTIETNPVRMIGARFCPDAPLGEAPVSVNRKGREPIAVGLRHNERGVVRGDRHTVGKSDAISNLASGSIRCEQSERPGSELAAGKVKALVVEIG